MKTFSEWQDQVSKIGYGQRGMTWSLGSGEYAVENGDGSAVLFSYDKDDYPRSIKKVRDLNPEEFQAILRANQHRLRRARRTW